MSAMDISEDAAIVSLAQTTSGLSISIHPLVLLNISDHYTRARLQDPNVLEKGRIYGALLAQQTGREVDIVNSFELPLGNEVDHGFLTTKLEQLKQVFPNLDFMGWYSLGASPTESDLQFHQQFSQVSDSCIFLQLDPNAITSGIKEFPVHIYESTIDISDGQMRLAFVKAAYKVETSEAEMVAVDHVAKPSTSSNGTSLSSTLATHLTTQRNAMAMLHSRIEFLHAYLRDTKAGVIPVDHDIVRQISSLCRRSPLMDNSAFNRQFATEENDVLLAAYLTTLTKGMDAMNDLIDKFNLVHGGAGSVMAGKLGAASPTAAASSAGRRRMRMRNAHG